MHISTWALLASLSLACGEATGGPQAADAATDAGAPRVDVGVLGPQCAAVAACCPGHLDMFASLAECEAFAARQGEDLCMDRRRDGWCGVDAGP